MEVLRAFGRAIKARRAEIGITQEDLARAANMSRAHISSIERGTNNAGISAVYNLSKSLDCKASELWLKTEKILGDLELHGIKLDGKN